MEEFPVPGKLADVERCDATIRGRNVYSSTLDKKGANNALDFITEASLYKERILSSRRYDHLKVIETVAQELDFSPGIKIICCVLSHVKEQTASYRLEGLIDSIAEANGHTVIFINGAEAGDKGEMIDNARDELRQRFASRSQHVSIVTNLFKVREPLSTIRGILADSVLLAAERAGLRDPIITSSDIDVIAVPDNYGRVIIEEFRSPQLDILSGPVFYGYDHLGLDYTDVALRAPELLLGNRAAYARKIALASGVILGDPFYPTDGPNIAYRLSAYCAAGGYNYAVDVGEDIYIGAAIFGIRNRISGIFPQHQHASYSSAFWVATDPRRQLLSICSGYSIEDSWSFIPFSTSLGSAMKTPDLVPVYCCKTELIQCTDLIPENATLTREKLRHRTLTVFQEAIRNDSFSDPVVAFLARVYGLNVAAVSASAGHYDISAGLIEALQLCRGETRSHLRGDIRQQASA